MSFAMLLSDANNYRPLYSTSIETTGVDYVNRFTKHESPRVKVTGEVSVSRRRRNPSARSALLSGVPLA